MRTKSGSLQTGFGLICCGLVLVAAAAGAPSPSSVALMSSSNPSTLGQPLTITATVTTGATGKVTFYDSTAVLGITTLAGGQARLTTSLLASGVHTLHAHYSGDGAWLASDSTPLVQTITALPGNGFQQVANPGIASSPIVADFNNDGKLDLAAGGSIWLGRGDGTFQRGAIYSGSLLAVGDFNGDGNIDLIVISSNSSPPSNPVTVLLGNGDGTFRQSGNYPAGAVPNAAAVADFNGDGKVDLVTAGGFLLLGNGDGSFQPPVSYGLNGYVVVVFDFNGDGKADLALQSSNGANNGLNILLGNGDGTFRPPINIYPSLNISSAAVGDFNGDGKPDLALGTGTLLILLGNGDGTFQTPKPYPAYVAQAVAVGDFNGDGKADVVMGSMTGVAYALGKGDGTFPPLPVNLAALNTPYLFSLAIGDFNRDGRTDFVFGGLAVTTFLAAAMPDLTISATHSAGFAPATFATYTIAVRNLPFAPTSGAVRVTDSLPPGVTPVDISGPGWSCALATLTCTRSDSLAPGAGYPSIVITVLVGANVPGSITNTATVSGGGDTNPANNTTYDTILFRTAGIVMSSSPNPAILGQAVTLTATVMPSGTGRVTFYDGVAILGTSPIVNVQATLTTRLLAEGSHSLHAVFVADLTSPYASSISGNIAEIITELPANGFRPAANYATPGNALAIAAGDFNGDGNADLAIAGDRNLAVLLGNGDGTFRASSVTSITFTSLGSSLVAADFNGDGKLDLLLSSNIATSEAQSNFSILLGNGDGTFQPAVAVGRGLGSAAVADFNGDGKPDVAFFANATLLTVLPGNGDGSFASPLSYVSSEAAGYFSIGDPRGYVLNIVAGDFNGDGKVDLAFPTQASPPLTIAHLTVLAGNGDGTFQAPMTSPAGNGHFIDSLFLADFNLDGKPDLAINYFNLSEATVVLGKGDATFVQSGFSYAGALVATADFNGDGRPDLVVFTGHNSVRVLLGNGDGSFQAPMIVPTGGGPGPVAVGDFNGDGRLDMAVANAQSLNVGILLGALFPSSLRTSLTVWRPATGTWYVNPYNTAPLTQHWGLPGDIPVAADFDHDGVFDYAVWRPSNGTWYVIPSNLPAVPETRAWGLPGDIPVPGDFDGDGKADYAVWRPSNGTWYIIPSSNAFSPITRQWGLPNDIPVVADLDGDGKTDYAVWRPAEGNWYILLSSTGATEVKQWGLLGDIPVAADFDGDGKADLAVWRPSNGTWYIIPSSAPATTLVTPWGLPGDIPVPRDYDGDGKADLAVWRPSNGTWYIIPSATPAAPLTIQWGLPNDVPIYKPAPLR